MIIGGILNLLTQHSIDINDHYSLVTFNLLERLRSIRECTRGVKLQGDEWVGGGFSDGGRKRKNRGQRYGGEMDGMGWGDGRGTQVLEGRGGEGGEAGSGGSTRGEFL